MKKGRLLMGLGLLTLAFTGIICVIKNVNPQIQGGQSSTTYEKEWEEAKNTPYGKYPELVTYTLGKMAGHNNSNMPKGDTYENNAYTRYFREKLNIQNTNVFEESDNYNDIVYMSVMDGNIPDVMVIMDPLILQTLVEEDLIADLTDMYEKCASPRIKQIYESYDTNLLESVTIDGKLMALPETNIYNGPDLLWLRKDWMDKLGLKDPTTLQEAEYIIEQFVKQNPGGITDSQTIGLLCDTDLVGDTNSCYSLDLLFATYDVYPQKWVMDETGKAVYSSTTSKMKEALKHLHELYMKGIIDKQFVVRSEKNLSSLVVDGKCGAFFGPWWAPNNPLMEAYAKDPNANWQPYVIPTNKDGSIHTYKPYANNKSVVVRKGFEHPELVMKMINMLFDYGRYEDKEAEEINSYYALNVDTTARPLVINVDYSDALFRMTTQIKETLIGKKSEDELLGFEQSYYRVCQDYLNNPNPTPIEWAAYTSRITATEKLLDSEIVYDEWLFEESNALSEELKLLEKDTFLQIITGEKPIEYFDEFVAKWNRDGGLEETVRINDKLKK